VTRRAARALAGVPTSEQPIALARRSARRSRIAAWIFGGFGLFISVPIVAPVDTTNVAANVVLSAGLIAGSAVSALRARRLTRHADAMVAALAGPAAVALEPPPGSRGHQALVRLQDAAARLALLTPELATVEPDLVLVARSSEQALGKLARRIVALELTDAPDADVDRLTTAVSAGLDGYEDLVRAAAGVVAGMTTADVLRVQELHRATEQLRFLEQGLREVAAINEPYRLTALDAEERQAGPAADSGESDRR
jgi:hypothetical protein